MDRRTIALYSYLALLVPLAGFFVGSALRDPYSDPPVALELGALVLLLLIGLHLWYFRREWEELRLAWVRRRPWLRSVVRTRPFASPRSMAASAGWFSLAVVLLTLWMLLVAP